MNEVVEELLDKSEQSIGAAELLLKDVYVDFALHSWRKSVSGLMRHRSSEVIQTVQLIPSSPFPVSKRIKQPS
jgi:hypothetical protein